MLKIEMTIVLFDLMIYGRGLLIKGIY